MNLALPPEIFWAIAGYFAVKIIDWVLLIRKRDTQLKDETIKRLEVSMDDNSDALTKLKYAIEALEKSIMPLPRIEKDVNEAHAKIREITAVLNARDI